MQHRWIMALVVAVLLALAAGVWAQGSAVQSVEVVPGHTLIVKVGGYPVEWRPVNVATDVTLPVAYSDVPVAKAEMYSLADGSLLGIVQFQEDVPR